MSFVMGSPTTMLIVLYLLGTKLSALRRIALMACSILSEVGVDGGCGWVVATLNGGNLTADFFK